MKNNSSQVLTKVGIGLLLAAPISFVLTIIAFNQSASQFQPILILLMFCLPFIATVVSLLAWRADRKKNKKNSLAFGVMIASAVYSTMSLLLLLGAFFLVGLLFSAG